MNIPQDVIKILETEIDGMEYGLATLTIHRRGSNIRYTIGRERSFLEDTYLRGVDETCLKNDRNKNES
jgi:hypothetical protein